MDRLAVGRHNTQYNDTQHNGSKADHHNDTNHIAIQHNHKSIKNTQHNDKSKTTLIIRHSA
jgi:hypothetical protein